MAVFPGLSHISSSHGFVSEEPEKFHGRKPMCDPWQLPSSRTCLSAWCSCCLVMNGKGDLLSNLRTPWQRHVQMTWSSTIVGLGQWYENSGIGCLPNSFSLMFSFIFTRSSWTSSWYPWRKGMTCRVWHAMRGRKSSVWSVDCALYGAAVFRFNLYKTNIFSFCFLG